MSTFPERNIEAYRLLYLIKNHFHDLLDNYNFSALKIDRPSLADYIYVLHKIKRAIDDDTAADLYRLIPIRNKVCHMQPINNKELLFVERCWRTIKSLS